MGGGNPAPIHPGFCALSYNSHHQYLPVHRYSFYQGFASVQLGGPLPLIVHTFTYGSFMSKLWFHLSSLGVDPKLYTGHSFHRGGASFTYQSGVPIELIKALGDWRSDTILIYLTMPLTVRLHSANMLCKAISYYTHHLTNMLFSSFFLFLSFLSNTSLTFTLGLGV